MTILETERLRLRRMTRDDALFMHELMNEPEFISNVADRGIRTPADAARWIEEKILPSYERHGFGFYIVELRAMDAAIGICGLVKREALPDVDLGFAFLPSFRSNGYGVESATAVMAYATSTLGLTRIVAIVNPENEASIRLLEKLGTAAWFRPRHWLHAPPQELPGEHG